MSSSLVLALCSLFSLLWAGVPLAQAQDNTTCASLQHYVNEHPGCSIPTDVSFPCSELYCFDDVPVMTMSLIIDKCEDPITLGLYVILYPEIHLHFLYLNQSKTIHIENYSFYGIMERNATHLGVRVSVQYNNGSIYSVLDPLYIYLDPGDCMCNAMSSAASQIAYHSDFSCDNPDEECTRIRCDRPTQSISLYVTPCDVPPSLQFNIFTNGHLQITSANGNQTTPLSDNGVELEITMWHFDYSMDVELTVIGNITTQTILPRHKIILDLIECGPPHPITINTTGCDPNTGSMCPTSDTPTYTTATSATTHTDGPTDDGSSSPPTHDTPSSETSPTTSEPSFQSACSAMNDIKTQIINNPIFNGTITCDLYECNVIECFGPPDGDLTIVLLCSPILAVGIQYTDEESLEIFTKSGTLKDGTVVTVENRGGNVLDFALENPVSGLTLVNHTRISLKSCSSGLSKAVLATSVTVPLVVLLLIAAVIVIVAGVYWARQRPNRHYNFRHVTMSQVQEC